MISGLRGHAGLRGTDAIARLASDGYNELPSAAPRRLWAIAWEVVREPMFLLLVACGAIYLLLGDVQEALVLLGVRVRGHGHHVLPGAKDRARAGGAARPVQPARAGDPRRRAAAHRRARGGARRPPRAGRGRPRAGGRACCSSAGNLVGRRVAADRRIGAGAASVAGDGAIAMGTARRRRPALRLLGHTGGPGPGVARVAATGGQHRDRARSARRCRRSSPRRRRSSARPRRLVRLASPRSGLCAVRWSSWLYGLTRGDWLDGLLAGITLAMAMLPEEFPVVLTSSWRSGRGGCRSAGC